MVEATPVALFDLDGTLVDYETALIREMDRLRSPGEPPLDLSVDPLPEYLENRSRLVRTNPGWWEGLKPFRLGWEVLELARIVGFTIHILTQGPRRLPHAWEEKVRWVHQHLGQDVLITVTRDKGSVYGKLLVDDYPEYIKKWLQFRPRGAVIMPANAKNVNFVHPQVLRYDGSNFDEMKLVVEQAYWRRCREQ